MTDIFHEVEADLRREKAQHLWQRFGAYVIVVAILIVVGVAGWRGYLAWQTARDRAEGDRYLALLAEADGARTATAAEELERFATEAPAGYALLARMRAATTFEQASQPDEAIRLLRAVAGDPAVDALYGDLARIRLARLLVDGGNTVEAKEIAGPLAEDAGNPFTRSAQETMGLVAYIDGDLAGVRRWYTDISTDVATSSAMRQRAQAMLALLTQIAPEEVAGDADAAGGAPTAAPPSTAAGVSGPAPAEADADASGAIEAIVPPGGGLASGPAADAAASTGALAAPAANGSAPGTEAASDDASSAGDPAQAAANDGATAPPAAAQETN